MNHTATDWVEYNAFRLPNALALESVDTGDTFTWRVLHNRVAALAGVLADRFGVGRGDRVVVVAENDTRIFELQFACMRLGALLVPLNWRLATAELTALCGDAEPAVVAHDADWQSTAVALAQATGRVPTLGWDCADTPNDYERLLGDVRPRPACHVPLSLDDPTHILYTSGTTGMPKGAFTTFGTLAWQTLNVAQIDRITGPDCKLLNPLPLFHAGGLHTLANPILLSGGSVAVMRRFDAERVLELLGSPEHGITHFGSVPTMLQLMGELPGFTTGDFSRLRHIQVGGGSTHQALLEMWADRGQALQTHYGGTEMGPAVAAMPAGRAHDKPGSCGLPVQHTQVRFVAPDGAEAAADEIGEIWISGPSVTPGYWRRDRAEHGFEGGWFRTGDAAVRDDEGFVYLVDRVKDMYKSGGENVFPAEVERCLAEHPDIREISVVGVADELWGEVGLAVVVTHSGRPITRQELLDHCAGRIAKYKVPHHVVRVDRLERNATGKVVKSELRTRYGPAVLGG